MLLRLSTISPSKKNGKDITSEVLSADHVLLVVSYDLRKAERDGLASVKNLTDRALKKGYKVIGLTASGQEKQQQVIDKYDLNFEFYQTDETALKTIVRANPAFLTLQKGTITQKEHWFDADDIEL